MDDTLKICQLNVEGISKAKCDYLHKLLQKENIDVLVLQETHVPNAEKDIYRIPGFTNISSCYHPRYGLAIYTRSGLQDTTLLPTITLDNHTDMTAIQVNDLKILNIYKPPNTEWDFSNVPNYSHPAIYLGDFNSHHTSWGYHTDDIAGEQLTTWASSNELYLLHNPKDKATFWSARWNRGYNPDLTFITTDDDGIPLPASRRVCDMFPNSQHRPIIIEIGLSITSIPSPQYARWNLKKADWTQFTSAIEQTIKRIPPTVDNIHRANKLILKAATVHIPRGYVKRYVPGWSERSEELLKAYQNSKDQETGRQLLKSLDDNRRDKWVECVENTDFTKSSKKAWNLLKRLSGQKTTTPPTTNIKPEQIAARLIENSRGILDKSHKSRVKKCLSDFMKSNVTSNEVTNQVTSEEVSTATKKLKLGKAAGVDNILPEFLHHLGPLAVEWFAEVFTAVIKTGEVPKFWKHANVIAILKPGKSGEDATHYRPISLLCVPYKLLERVILQRIGDQVDSAIPIEQAAFRLERGCCEQVLSLASHIEHGFDQKHKVGGVFVDLTAAFDTVWKHGLVLKLTRIVPCSRLARLVWNLLNNRTFTIRHNGSESRKRVLNNGLPQGSVLSPVLFNVYTADMPETKAQKFAYADDIALLAQAKTFQEVESILNEDLNIMENYFKLWRLKPNPSKTVSSCFHLNSREAHRHLNLIFCGTHIHHEINPTYLGIKLDRTLTYKAHLTSAAAKVSARANIIAKLAGTTWGASADVLRTSALGLVYSSAEYCAPVWAGSKHTSLVDVQLNKAMRTISGTLKPTNTLWLPTLSNIHPPDIRRDVATLREYERLAKNPALPIHQSRLETPRLKSRRPFWNRAETLAAQRFDPDVTWRDIWENSAIPNRELLNDPTQKPPGFNLPRKAWTALNRFRTGMGRCKYLMHRWGLAESESCDCGEIQTMQHIVAECPQYHFDGGLEGLNACTDGATSWLRDLRLDI